MIKCQFGYTKTRYRDLMKNENRIYAMFECVNLLHASDSQAKPL
jgi:IS5 family transposase